MRLLSNRVQICHNEVWGYVCTMTTYDYTYDYYTYSLTSDWTDEDASVVCRELGFSPQGSVFYLSAIPVYLIYIYIYIYIEVLRVHLSTLVQPFHFFWENPPAMVLKSS